MVHAFVPLTRYLILKPVAQDWAFQLRSALVSVTVVTAKFVGRVQPIVMVTESSPEQPFLPVPTTLYVVVTVGVAITVLPVVALNAVEGDQAYKAAPEAFKLIVEPGQSMAFTGITFNPVPDLTLTVTFPELAHPLLFVAATV